MVDLVGPKKPDKSKKLKKETSQPVEEPAFVPPQLIKNNEPSKEPSTSLSQNDGRGKLVALWQAGISRLIRLRKLWSSLDLKLKGAFVLLLFVCLFGLSRLAVAFWPIPNNPWPEANMADYPKPEIIVPTTEPSKLTGLPVKLAINKGQVIGVMIENSPDARPQSGFTDAGMVFEAIAEGGITRFLALYLDKAPNFVGPVRSARPYYLRWAISYDAAYAHVGGSPNALKDIKKLGLKDLDQFNNPAQYQRVSNRYAPHNVYTNIKELQKLANSKGWKTSDFIGLKRLEEESKAHIKPNSSLINFDISSELYNVQYRFNAKNNSYSRYMVGQKHIDEKSGKQIAPKVVVAMITEQGYESDGLHLTYKTTGKGAIYVFQNGRVAKGTWSKKSDKAKLQFLDSKGELLVLNPGQTWITVLGNKNQVSYK